MNPGLKAGFVTASQSPGVTKQPTSKSTAVRVDKMAGVIETFPEAITTSGGTKTFTVYNSLFRADDILILQNKALSAKLSNGLSGTLNSFYDVETPASSIAKDGEFVIRMTNNNPTDFAVPIRIAFAIFPVNAA